VAFDEEGRDVVSGAIDGSLLVTRDGGAQLVIPACPGGIDAVGFLPDGRVVATGAQRRLRVYDRGGAVLADLEIPARIRSLRTDGDRLVAVPMPPRYVGNATSPLLLDLERYRVVAQLEGHVGRVFSARWIAGGQVLTAGADGTARLWDGATGQIRQTYEGSSRFLADAALASDDLVVAGGADGFLRFWDKGSGRLLWTFRTRTSPIAGLRVEGGDIVPRGFAGELARWTLPSPGQVLGACGDREGCAILLDEEDASEAGAVQSDPPRTGRRGPRTRRRRARLGQRAVPGRGRHGPHRLPDHVRRRC
jgi:WD40 repeat protein